MNFVELIQLITSIFISYFGYTILSSLLFQFVLFKKKCTGSNLTDGCGKTIYPYKFNRLFINLLFRNIIIIILSIFNKKKSSEMGKNPKYGLQYEKKFKGIDFEIGGNVIYGHCCKDCLDKHDAISIAITLSEEV